jgi:hypothetical protein
MSDEDKDEFFRDFYNESEDSRPYEITRVNEFAKKIGKVVAKEIYMSMDELKKSISVKNIKGIIYEYSDTSEEGYPILTTSQLNMVCEDIFSWLAGVRLAKEAADDKLECYWNKEKKD